MDLQLKGKTALVTGGSEGIGKGIAMMLAKEGVDVAICARTNSDLANVAAEVLGPVKGEKLVIQKMRRRKNFRRKTGERHVFTRVRIGKISV